MATPHRKIINDPVYGFITIDHPLIFEIISHPYYQRLRRIHQMALAHLVYPGAVHTRLHHSLGAYHLMSQAITELKNKKFKIIALETSAKAVDISTDFDFSQPTAFIIGNERFGLDKDQLESADEIRRIPTFGVKNSLNAAVAAAIAGY